MLTLCTMFGCTNKTVNKLLSFYWFPKFKIFACLDLKTLIQSQQNTYNTKYNLLHRSDVSKKNINHMRISSVNFNTSNYFNKLKILFYHSYI